MSNQDMIDMFAAYSKNCSQELGNGVDFKSLVDIRCANNLKCTNSAYMKCSSCRLVAYCSKEC